MTSKHTPAYYYLSVEPNSTILLKQQRFGGCPRWWMVDDRSTVHDLPVWMTKRRNETLKLGIQYFWRQRSTKKQHKIERFRLEIADFSTFSGPRRMHSYPTLYHRERGRNELFLTLESGFKIRVSVTNDPPSSLVGCATRRVMLLLVDPID